MTSDVCVIAGGEAVANKVTPLIMETEEVIFLLLENRSNLILCHITPHGLHHRIHLILPRLEVPFLAAGSSYRS